MRANVTIGEKYGPAMEITTQENADSYFEELVQHDIDCFGLDREEAESLNRQNLGYYAGYYSQDVYERVHRLFRCQHPIFGTTYPSPEEAFNKGKEAMIDEASTSAARGSEVPLET